MQEQIKLEEHQRAFHMAEFQKLNAEIAELIKSASQLFSVAVAGSGALFAWLLTAKIEIGLRALGFVIPALLTYTLAKMASAQAERIKQMGSYLTKLEDRLGHPALGWQKHFEPMQSVIGRSMRNAWLILLIGNLVAAVGFILLPIRS